ncbi:hypothetical protein [Pontibacter sp. G13]|uniref:hypothetical protein n=1 Tax=Pontibacter sp. G13 TaxID=3074898 RepID=UPI00288C26C6|nr:hypothetical protein [Pontibacter sp. G13]WNJ16953.1 hypothetical protein RJD25_19035 [Pontibacter sp. G13]
MKFSTQHSVILTTLFALIGLFTFSACEGPRGPQGPPGLDGNFNVFSIYYNLQENDWIERGTAGAPGFFLEVELDVPEIDQIVVDDGIVLVYYRAQASDPWIFLPYTFIGADNPNFIEVFDFIYGDGFVNMKSQGDDFNATRYSGTVRVIVADGIPINKQAIDYSNYEETVAFLGLEP